MPEALREALCARSAGKEFTRQEAVTLFCEIGNRRLHEMESFNLTENMRATIAEFAERLTARSARTEWVAVAERTPDAKGFYQVWDKVKGRCGILFWQHNAMSPIPVWTYTDEEPWSGYFAVGLEITHWMPLPSGPENATSNTTDSRANNGR